MKSILTSQDSSHLPLNTNTIVVIQRIVEEKNLEYYINLYALHTLRHKHENNHRIVEFEKYTLNLIFVS